MNTKSGIFTRGSAFRENTAFGVHSVKILLLVFMSEIKIEPRVKILFLVFMSEIKVDLILRKTNILYFFIMDSVDS